MQAKKCDRCKKLYEYYESKDHNISVNAVAKARITVTGASVAGPYYDLCPECMNKFIEFLKGKDDLNMEKEGYEHD